MKHKFLFFFFLSSFCFLGIGCSTNSDDFSFQLPERNTEWQEISPTTQLREFPVTTNETSIELVVYKIDPSSFETQIHHDKPNRFSQWATETNANILINGGFFNEKNEPTGWLVIDGNVIGENQYSPDASGLILIKDGFIDLLDSNQTTQTAIDPTTSLLQSFPVLIKTGGIPGVKEDSEKIARRTVLAKTISGELLIILVDQTPVSLYTLMNGLLASDLDITIALNLDGGPSSGLIASIDDHSKSIIPLTPLPQVVSFSQRPRGQ